MMSIEKMKTTQSEEYKTYMKALCRLASMYVPRIRAQFAAKAYEKFQDASTRRLVLAYGEEAEALDRSRLRDFTMFSDCAIDDDEPITKPADYLNDYCLNKASDYGNAVKLLFDIC